MSWRTYGDWAYFVATFVTILFAVLYCISAPWWKTVGGRNIMAVMGSVALAFGYFAWAIWHGGVPVGFHPMRAALFTFIALAIGWRVVILIRFHIIKSLRTRKEVKQR